MVIRFIGMPDQYMYTYDPLHDNAHEQLSASTSTGRADSYSAVTVTPIDSNNLAIAK
jgi:hypothetical protein